MKCRSCQTDLKYSFLDLGSAPPSNAYLVEDELYKPEVWYPLKLMVCNNCLLVQTLDFAGREIFFDENYSYFSSYSSTWLAHAKIFVQEVVESLRLNSQSYVIEIAANDGYLLQYFHDAGVPCLGVEPTASTAEAARKKGLNIVQDFFGVKLAEKLNEDGRLADLVVANNVLAHVPDINDFVQGIAGILKPGGVASFEFPHLLNLVQKNQFDTVYHEHFSYLSLITVRNIFNENGLNIFDVAELDTHGGSLRVFAQLTDFGEKPISEKVSLLIKKEIDAGMQEECFYQVMQKKAEEVKFNLLKFLLEAKFDGKKVAGYGAAAKANTILNFSGIRSDLISYVVDVNPYKQGKFLPGSRIPIVDIDFMKKNSPDYILIFPWNINEEIVGYIEAADIKNAIYFNAIPNIKILN